MELSSMETSLIISIIAIIISVFAAISSFYFQFRDKVKLKTSLNRYEYIPEFNDRARLTIKIVNKGRRPALLTLFGGNLANNGWVGSGLGEEDKFIRLSESEFYERDFYKEDIEQITPEMDYPEFVDLWFQDSLGNRHIIKGSRNGIIWLKKQQGP